MRLNQGNKTEKKLRKKMKKGERGEHEEEEKEEEPMKDEKALPGGRSVAPACAPATPRSVALLRVDEFPWRIIMGITARHTHTHTETYAYTRCADLGPRCFLSLPRLR